MKLLEVENDLRDVNSFKELGKFMLGNGIVNVKVDGFGMQIETTPYGLVETVPIEKWEILKDDFMGTFVGIKDNTLEISCDASKYSKREFTEITGFKFPEVTE